MTTNIRDNAIAQDDGKVADLTYGFCKLLSSQKNPR